MPPALVDLAQRQAGVFTRAQALDCGLSGAGLVRLRRRGIVVALAPGVYAAATDPATEVRTLWVAVLSADAPVAVAEHAACALLGLADGSLARPVIAVPGGRKPCAPPGARVRRVTFWTELEVVRRDGLPVLGVRDAILTAARVSSVNRLIALIQDAAFQRRLDPVELAVRRRRGLPGSGRLGAALAIYWRGHDSGFEAAGYRVLESGGEAPDHTNVVLIAPDGRRTGPWDQHWEDGRVADLDGRPFHSSARAKERDRRKTAGAEDLGLDAVRWTSDDVADGPALIAEVAARRLAVADWPPARRLAVAALRIEHLPGRGCVCGHQPTRTMSSRTRRGDKKAS